MATVKDIFKENLAMMRVLKYRTAVTVAVFALGSLMTYFEAMIMRRFIDSLASLSDISVVTRLGFLLLLITLTSYALSFYGEYLLQTLGLEGLKVLVSRVFNSLYHARLQLIRASDVLARIVSDIPELAHVITEFVPALLINVINFIVVMFTLNVLSPQLLIVALLLIPVNYVVYRVASKRISYYSGLERKNLSAMVSEVKTTIDSLFLIKRSAAFSYFSKRISSSLRSWITSLARFILYKVFFNKSYFYLNSILRIIILIVGGILVSWGEISIGSLIAFSSILTNLYEPIMNIANFLTGVAAYTPHLERYYEILNLEYERGSGKPLNRVESIVLENVSVVVNGKEILRGVNMKISKGQVIGIKGPIGSGKTTLALLLARFYEPAAGRVLVNGTDYREYAIESLRRKIYYVPPKDIILPASLRENLTLGKQVPEDTLREALKIARIDFADLDMFIDPERLSEGQKQKVAIARALTIQPDVLILDEATNSLDKNEEREVINNIRKMKPQLTLILISHRESTLSHANILYEIQDGKTIKVY